MIEELRVGEPTRVLVYELENVLQLHARALACHCECLGMNAENSFAVSMGAATIPFNDSHYRKAAKKWGLADEGGNPII